MSLVLKRQDTIKNCPRMQNRTQEKAPKTNRGIPFGLSILSLSRTLFWPRVCLSGPRCYYVLAPHRHFLSFQWSSHMVENSWPFIRSYQFPNKIDNLDWPVSIYRNILQYASFRNIWRNMYPHILFQRWQNLKSNFDFLTLCLCRPCRKMNKIRFRQRV